MPCNVDEKKDQTDTEITSWLPLSWFKGEGDTICQKESQCGKMSRYHEQEPTKHYGN